MRRLISELKRLNIPITERVPWCQHEDGRIILGGLYDGVHVQVGKGYYHVVKENEDGRLKFFKGHGDLEGELKRVLK